MPEGRVAQLLEEIRDLQRRQLENQERSIANQERALNYQRQGIRRALPIFLLILFLMVYGPWLWRWLMYLMSD